MNCDKFPPNRKVSDLDEVYRERFIRYLNALEATFPQFRVIITETRRSEDRQRCLMGSGASKTEQSNHLRGMAVDIALYRHATRELDWRPAVFRNVYRQLDPRRFGLTSGAFLWGWDEGHLQPVELQGPGSVDLGRELEVY